MEKYYIEISDRENPCEYELQSEWFDTEQEAVEWAKSISFLDKRYSVYLMSSEWDIEEDTYTDIQNVRDLDIELELMCKNMKPVIYFDSRGESGNIYYILGKVQEELRKRRKINDFNELRDRVFRSHSYKEALSVIREYVDLIDLDEVEG